MDDIVDISEVIDEMEEDELVAFEEKRLKENAYMRSYSSRRAKEYKWMKSHCMYLARELLDAGKLGELSDISRRFLEDVLERWPRKFPPLLVKLYGGDVRVGASATARQALETIYKSKNDMVVIMKRWRKKGIDIGYELDPEGGPLEARYVIRALPFDITGGINMTAADLDRL